MSSFKEKIKSYPSINKVVRNLVNTWPEHESYCEARFKDDNDTFLKHVDEFSELALKLIDSNLTKYNEDYRWMCERFLEEEFYFRRHGKYRLATFQEAYDEVYNDVEYMDKYIKGILISQIIWHPHAKAFDFFRTQFLINLPEEARYLEVGPGHGLFLYFASLHDSIKEITAWDVSYSSIAATKLAMKTLGVTKSVNLVKQDVLVASSEPNSFDVAVISEVLEHLEKPEAALKTLYDSLKAGGKIYINIPLNSPAPDHIYLWRTADEFVELVKQIGFTNIDVNLFPVTGATLERAEKQDLSISCVVIAEK